MIVTVANLKGGVGKTTSAVLLAHALVAGVVDIHVITTRIPLREALALAWGDPVTDLYGYDQVATELMRSSHG